MVRAGIGKSVVLAAVLNAPREQLDASPDGLAALQAAEVPPEVMGAILGRVKARGGSPAQAAEPAKSKVVLPTSVGEVRLYFTEKPSSAYREIGRVSVSKYSTMGRTRKQDVVEQELRQKAWDKGGHAVIAITEDFASISGVIVVLVDK